MPGIHRRVIGSLRLRGPLAADPTAQTLHALLVGILAFAVAAYSIQRPFSPNKPVSMWNAIILIAGITTALALLHRGFLRGAGLTYLMTMWVFATVVVRVAGGVRTFGVAYFLALPILAAWLLGYRAALWNVALSVGAGLLFTIAETVGFWRFPTPTPFGAWIHLTLATMVAAVPVARTLRSLRNALAESHRAQQELQGYEKDLEILVQQLRQSELKYRRLHESLTDAVATVDMRGRILEFNNAFMAMLGYDSEELRQLTNPDITPQRWNDFEARIITEEVLPKGHSEVYEKEYRRRDGTVFPIELRTHLLRDESGQPIGMWAIIRDITERTRAERALRASEQQLNSIYNTVTDMIFCLAVESEGEYRFVSVNSAFLRVTGLRREDVVGKTANEVIPEFRSVVLGRYRQAVQEKTVVSWEETRDYPAGRLTGVVSVAPVFDQQGACTHLVGSVHDITDHKRAEEERERLRMQLAHSQKLESIGRLAGGIAHDFNNLMSAVLLNAESALDELKDDDSAAESVTAIRDTAQKAIAIGRQLMAFSSRQVLQNEVLELNSVIADSQKLVRRLIGEDIKVVLEPRARLGFVNADRGQLGQVLWNLAVNSRDAMPDGGTFTIETSDAEFDQTVAELSPDAKPGAYVVLTVSDTGLGMDQETQARIFEPFFTTKGFGKGSGLGLSVVYGIVKQSGGFITVESERGKGTTFRICLPTVSERPARLVDGEDTPIRGGSETILLVEDESALREKVHGVLAKAGYRVLAALDGEHAFRLAFQDTRPIHLLLTDVVMPNVSGPRLAERLVALRPGARVLYMSGYPMADNVAYDANLISNLIQKPFTREQLLRRVRSALDEV